MSGGATGVLLRADARRLAGIARYPTASFWVGLFLPALLLTIGVAAVGSVAGARISSTQDGVTFGVLVAGPVAFLAYPTLFRGSDDAFLRRLGVPPGALYRERALRLLGWAVAIAALVGCAHAASGVSVGRILRMAVPVVMASWGSAALSLAAAARAMAGRAHGSGWGCLTAGLRDREVAGAAPLVYAPVSPLVAGALAGGIMAGVEGPAWMALISAAGVGAAVAASPVFAAALPRFAPQALEMSFAPHPSADGVELRARRGLARLLPRRAGAAWARDAAVAGRRFAWASRVVWPVVIFACVALARWGEHPGTRGWVVAATALVLVLQGAAAIGLGRMERAGSRWMDRSLGIALPHRFVGRWAWGWGLSLWLTVPLALAWSWWAGVGPGWVWVAVAAGTSGVAAAASMGAAGRR